MWTDDQKNAIELNDKDILVAAAAGSGKTAVLVERVVSHLLLPENDKNHWDVDRLMVVTFTNAAAEEMRQRIEKALEEKIESERLAENSDKKLIERLEKQKILLSNASISTMHSFCQNLIRQNFAVLDLDPAFRAGHDQEIKIMQQEVMEEVFEKYYENSDSFIHAFAEKYGSDKNGDEDNPLKNSAYFKVYLRDLSMHDALKTYLEATPGIRKVRASETTANTLSDFGKIVGYISIAIILILLAVGIFLISNTVMIGITVRKEEISIMKMIGATDTFVRLPFIVEGIIIGLIGAGIPLVILFFVYEKVMGYMMSQFHSLSGSASFIESGEIFAFMVPLALIIGAGIGFIGSFITIRKHLRV